MRQVLLLVILVCSISNVQAQQENYSELKSKVNEKSLPLVNIAVDINKVNKEKYIPAEIEITDYLKRTNNNLVTKLKCKIKYRGASSLAYEKKSFAIKLLNDEGKSLDVSILGIREDDSWILNAMAVDRIRMRDRLLFDVWNELSKTPYNTDYDNRNGTKGYFVEVFINEEYHGLYCMTDKINRKLLGLKKYKEDTNLTKGLLLKCNAWSDATFLLGYNDEPMNSEEWNNWELQYPDEHPSEETYMPLADLIDFCTTSSNNIFASEFEQHFWKQNILDYHIFYLTFCIYDNFLKNTFLSTTDITQTKKFMITPWDLDCSLGGSWDGTHYEVLVNNDNIITYPFARLWKENVEGVDGYRTELYNLWSTKKNNILSESAIEKQMNYYAESFVTSGAWEREYKKWNGNPVVLTKNPYEELDYVKRWFHSSHINLNNYFRNINTGIPVIDTNTSEKIKYNLSGQKVNENYKGIIIEDSKKKIVK